jgi:hypothetical protein
LAVSIVVNGTSRVRQVEIPCRGGSAPQLLFDKWGGFPACLLAIHTAGVTQITVYGLHELERLLTWSDEYDLPHALDQLQIHSSPIKSPFKVCVLATRRRLRRRR